MIYIVKHYECFSPNLSGYADLGVGKLFQHKGDNINYLNPYLNEATALYDIWKNSKDKIVGMCHYRRFFEKDGIFLMFKDAEEILKEHEIITTPDFTPPVTPYELLSRAITPYTLKKYIPMVGIKLVEHRLADSCRHAFYFAGHGGTDRILFTSDSGYKSIRFYLRNDVWFLVQR